MPRNVRNFWVTAEIDGRSSTLEGGPQAKDGGFDLTVRQRNDGEVTEALSIIARAKSDGTLVLTVWDGQGHKVFRHETER